VYSIEPEQKDILIEFIQELMASSDPAVLSSALFAYQEVCPDNWALLHQSYRKICHLLADFDEWGQSNSVFIQPLPPSTQPSPMYPIHVLV
jgi:AP-3 complex subunit beta